MGGLSRVVLGLSEDHIARLKDSGLERFPFSDWDANCAWLAVVCFAGALVRWFQLLCLAGPLAVAQPKRLRWQLWHTPARLVRTAGRYVVRILGAWPTSDQASPLTTDQPDRLVEMQSPADQQPPTQPAQPAEPPTVPAKAGETLSQFVAKVLDQLSLSAWLPSAALVLSLAFVANVRGARGDLAEAVGAFSEYKLEEGLFLFATVVVLTMLTQAFEFEAIQSLEGYWAPRRPILWLGDLFARLHQRRRDRVRIRRRETELQALERASTTIAIENARLAAEGKVPIGTIRDLEVIRARMLKIDVAASSDEKRRARDIRWKDYAPSDLVRRIESLREAERLYPAGNRILPTRLGNVLRSLEEEAFGPLEGPLSGAVRQVFHRLPISIQAEHDQYRTRLNLYCSMVYVSVAAMAVALWRLWLLGWTARAATFVIGVGVAVLCYRAAIASAKAYGDTLATIASITR